MLSTTFVRFKEINVINLISFGSHISKITCGSQGKAIAKNFKSVVFVIFDLPPDVLNFKRSAELHTALSRSHNQNRKMMIDSFDSFLTKG